ncbi:MAG TPA: biotin/lipoyl-binding protein [Planctomycetes bacterium]|nr:biotin/lipoyl-binding protein [Planctomycetota bacterium]
MRYFVKVEADGRRIEREIFFEKEGDVLMAHLVRHDEDGTEEVEVYPIDPCLLEKGRSLHLLVDGRGFDVYLQPTSKGNLDVHYKGDLCHVEILDEREKIAQRVQGKGGGTDPEIRASMPGVVVAVEVQEGQQVQKGQTLLVLEAMKMQNPIQAEADGLVEQIQVKAGDTVTGGDLLLRVVPA